MLASLGTDTLVTFTTRAKDAAKSRKILEGIQKADPGKMKQAVKANDDFIDEMVQLGLTGSARESGVDER